MGLPGNVSQSRHFYMQEGKMKKLIFLLIMAVAFVSFMPAEDGVNAFMAPSLDVVMFGDSVDSCAVTPDTVPTVFPLSIELSAVVFLALPETITAIAGQPQGYYLSKRHYKIESFWQSMVAARQKPDYWLRL